MLGHVLMDWPVDVKKMLIRKAYEALNPGGFLLIYDEIIDNDRKKNLHALFISMHMQLCLYGHEFTYQ